VRRLIEELSNAESHLNKTVLHTYTLDRGELTTHGR